MWYYQTFFEISCHLWLSVLLHFLYMNLLCRQPITQKDCSGHKKRRLPGLLFLGARNWTAPIATPLIYLIAIRCVTIIQKTNNTSAIQENAKKVTKKKSAVFKNKSENG